MRLTAAFLCLPLLAGCSQPGFLDTSEAGPPPPLLPMEQLLSSQSPQLDAEAAEALTARGAALRARAATAG